MTRQVYHQKMKTSISIIQNRQKYAFMYDHAKRNVYGKRKFEEKEERDT